jgi:hypothetical protein
VVSLPDKPLPADQLFLSSNFLCLISTQPENEGVIFFLDAPDVGIFPIIRGLYNNFIDYLERKFSKANNVIIFLIDITKFIAGLSNKSFNGIVFAFKEYLLVRWALRLESIINETPILLRSIASRSRLSVLIIEFLE